MENVRNVAKTFHQILHGNAQNQIIPQLTLCLFFINKSQELELLKSSNLHITTEMRSIYSFITLTSFINVYNNDQILLFLIFCFIFHLVLLLVVILETKMKITQISIFGIINSLMLFYMVAFYVPITYISLRFLQDNQICYDSKLCGSGSLVLYIIFSSINIIISSCILLIHFYFAKCDKLVNEDILLVTEFRFIQQFFIKICLLLVTILSAFNMYMELRVSLLIIKWILSISDLIKRQYFYTYIIIEFGAFCIAITMLFNLSLYELLLIYSFGILTLNQINQKITQYYITTKDQENLITISLLHNTYRLDAPSDQKIVRMIISTNHICKRRCKYSNLITECLLKSLANKQKGQELFILIYCDFISNHAPLKGLLRLLLHKSTNLYYTCAAQNLLDNLYNRSQQIQKEAKLKMSVKNSVEHSTSLDVISAYETFHSASLLFPIFIETIISKINFWTKLINGYNDIQQYIQTTYSTTQKILKCKKVVENRFDLTQNKLKLSPQADLLTMRILQIFYTGIYQNSYQAFTLEKNMEELLKSERFKQDESLDNIQLVQNRLFIFKTSLVSNRGDLIHLNQKQLAEFFNESEENIKSITHITQLMPDFISQVHDNLMDNYMQKGYSKLMIHGEQSFFLNTRGYIEPCTINLFNFYDNNNDFILNMILTKESQNLDTILFGVDGKILGITESTYNVLYEQFKTLSDLSQDFLKKGSLIQYFLPQITEQINELRQQISSSSNYQMNNIKGTWTLPSNLRLCVQMANQMLSKFQKKTKSNNSIYKSFKSQTYSKYTLSSMFSEFLEYDNNKIDEDILQEMQIDGVPIMLLHPIFQEVILSNDYDKNPKSALTLTYSLQFKQLKYKRGQLSYFILSLKESQKLDTTQISKNPSNPQSQGITLSNLSQQVDSENQNEVSIGQEQFYETTNHFKSGVQNILQNFDNSYLNQVSIDNSNVHILKSTDRNQLFDSSRLAHLDQKLFATNRQHEYNIVKQEVDQLELDMDSLQQRKIDFPYPDLAEAEEEQPDNLEKIQSSSQGQQQRQSNIIKKFMTRKQMKVEQGDFASNPSRTSTNSTSKEALLIVQQLYHNKQLITPLRKIGILLFLISSGIFACNFITVELIKLNLNQQTNEVNNLRQPQDLNYFYTSVISQMWANQLNLKGIMKLSPYLYQKNQDILASMFSFGRSSIQGLQLAIPQQASKLGYNQFQMSRIDNNTRVFNNITFEQFYQMMYEQIESIYRNNVNLSQEETDYSALYADRFVRLNIVQMVSFHNDLIVAIMNDTIKRQEGVKSQFLSIMFAELFTILFFIGIQLKFWLFIDDILKAIVLLVARLNEIQALDQISRLQLIKEQIEDDSSSRWKLFNFHQTLFEGIIEQKVKSIQAESNNKQTYKVSTALYSRIQITKYFKKLNVIITFVIAIIWTLFLMSGYLIHMQNNDDFQPSLIITLKFLQFRHNFDSCAMIGLLSKSETLISENSQQYIMQDLIISELSKYKSNLLPILNDCTTVIIEKAQRQGGESRFYGILSKNLCLQYKDQLGMCDGSSISLQYYQKDNYTNYIQNGVLGLTASFDKFLQQDYNYELINFKYDPNKTSLEEVVQSQQFQNLLVQYFLDIQDTLRNFLLLFQVDNSDIANSIIQIVSIYYLGLGIFLYLLLCITSIIWIYKSQMMANSIQQILVLIPLDQILNPNIRSQAKDIHNWLY